MRKLLKAKIFPETKTVAVIAYMEDTFGQKYIRQCRTFSFLFLSKCTKDRFWSITIKSPLLYNFTGSTPWRGCALGDKKTDKLCRRCHREGIILRAYSREKLYDKIITVMSAYEI